MAEMTVSRLWLMRAAFVALCIFVMFLHLLPLDTVPRTWAGPDIVMALAFAWALRRPDYVPAITVALVMLLGDLLLQRPPGLLALLVLLGTENLKTRARALREAPFLTEWSAVALVMIAIALGNRLVLSILVVPQAAFSLGFLQMGMTILCYAFVVAFTQFVMGVRKIAPGDVDLVRRGA